MQWFDHILNKARWLDELSALISDLPTQAMTSLGTGTGTPWGPLPVYFLHKYADLDCFTGEKDI